MPASTRKSAKAAHKAEAATMAANDSTKLNSPQVKRMRSVAAKPAKRQKTPQKTKKVNPPADDSETLAGAHSKQPSTMAVVAQFVEDDREVDFQVEAPTGEFLSEGEVTSSSSDSEIDFEQHPSGSQVMTRSQLSHLSDPDEGSGHSSRSRSWSESRSRSRSRSHK